MYFVEAVLEDQPALLGLSVSGELPWDTTYLFPEKAKASYPEAQEYFSTACFSHSSLGFYHLTVV